MTGLRRRTLFLAPMLACAPAGVLAAAADIGVVLMHGKWGGPDRFINSVELELRGAGFRVVSKEMPWSDRRAYDAGWDDAMAQIDREVAELKAEGVRKIVVGGLSMGANAALGYAARHPDVSGVVALAPGHTPERSARRPEMAASLAKARNEIAAGRGGQYANFNDINQGRSREVSARPAVYLSYFDPEGPAVMPRNAAMLSPGTALLWVVGTKDPLFREGSGYAFDRAPRNALSRFVTVEADHTGTPAAARRIVLDWVKGL
jgi:pimeloyl-ACP methyl ester carboxylesterase